MDENEYENEYEFEYEDENENENEGIKNQTSGQERTEKATGKVIIEKSFFFFKYQTTVVCSRLSGSNSPRWFRL